MRTHALGRHNKALMIEFLGFALEHGRDLVSTGIPAGLECSNALAESIACKSHLWSSQKPLRWAMTGCFASAEPFRGTPRRYTA